MKDNQSNNESNLGSTLTILKIKILKNEKNEKI